MRIEAGKYYRDADGGKRGPMERFLYTPEQYLAWHEGEKSCGLWHDDGSGWSGSKVSPRLIAEWTDKTARTDAELAAELRRCLADAMMVADVLAKRGWSVDMTRDGDKAPTATITRRTVTEERL